MNDAVACYVRVSTTEQAEHGYSIDEQIARLKSYCQAMRWTIYNVYTDAGVSGATINRPALQMLIEDIKAKRVDTVLVYKLDRLSRSQKDALYLIEEIFIGNGVSFVSMSENFDTESPFGRAMIGMLAVFAQLEREQIRERMSLGRTARAKTGKWHGGSAAPAGYVYDMNIGELVIDEYEAACIRRIFDLYSKGMRVITIQKTLQKEGVLHHNGHPFSVNTIKYILSNPIYKGVVTDKGNEYTGTHTPIVDVDTYNRVQDLRAAHKEMWDKQVRASPDQSMLSGLLYCARCGARYHIAKHRKESNRQYGCYSRTKKVPSMIKDPSCKNRYWNEPYLDGLIIEQVKQLAFDDAEIRRIQKRERKDASEVRTLVSRLSKLQTTRSRYMDLYAIGSLDMESVRDKIEPLNQQIAAVQSRIKILGGSIVQDGGDTVSVLRSAAELIDQGTTAEKRAILLSLIDRIDLDGDEITVKWKF